MHFTAINAINAINAIYCNLLQGVKSPALQSMQQNPRRVVAFIAWDLVNVQFSSHVKNCMQEFAS